MTSIVKTINLEKIYTSFNIETVALRKVNLEISEGEFVCIMGPSGCGKSTLLNILSLMDLPSSGEVIFMGKVSQRLSEKERAAMRRHHVGFVFQSFNLIDELSVYENIELPLIYQHFSLPERRKRVNEVMERLGIEHKSQFFPMQLSGGHQQRVAIARAIITNPRIIFADEPTGNLDSANGQEVIELLSELNAKGTTLVIVTHSTTLQEYANRTIHLFDGQIVTSDLSHQNHHKKTVTPLE